MIQQSQTSSTLHRASPTEGGTLAARTVHHSVGAKMGRGVSICNAHAMLVFPNNL
jgi:hypothetical protein